MAGRSHSGGCSLFLFELGEVIVGIFPLSVPWGLCVLGLAHKPTQRVDEAAITKLQEIGVTTLGSWGSSVLPCVE